MTDNARKAKEAADALFPGEEWIAVEDGIYLSPRRAIGEKSSYKEELRDAQILRDMGSVVYLAPESRRIAGKKFDAIVDGLKFEFKNIHGKSDETLIDHFYSSRGQAPNVFINLEESPFSMNRVIRVLYGARNSPKYDKKNDFREGGSIILKIRGCENLIYLDVDELKK